MYGGKTTLYEVLGVSRDAKLHEIGKAWNNFRAAQHDETVPPDPRRAAQVKEAYEILSDSVRREAYDESLRAPRVVAAEVATRIRPVHVAIAAGVLTAAVVAFIVLRPHPVPGERAVPEAEIATHVSAATVRVSGLQISGDSVPLGLAFAIAEDIMATSCAGFSPGMEVMVHIVPRRVQARLVSSDAARGLCRLAVTGSGGWPLEMGAPGPRAGEIVYGVRLDARGAASLVQGTVKRAAEVDGVRVLETTLPMAAEGRGGPLLDVRGRVVAIATTAPGDGAARFVAPPAGWSREPLGQVKAAPAPAASPAAPAAGDAPEAADAPARPGIKVSKEREKALEKAFRPPPSVPDDL